MTRAELEEKLSSVWEFVTPEKKAERKRKKAIEAKREWRDRHVVKWIAGRQL